MAEESITGANAAIEVEIRASMEHFKRDIEALRSQMQSAHGGLKKAIDQSTIAQTQFSRSLSNVAANIALLHGPLGGIASRITAMGSSIGRVGFLMAGFGATLTAASFGAVKALRSFQQLEKEQATYEGVLKATGSAAGKTAGDIEELAVSIRKSSTATEGAVRSASAIMLTFKTVVGDTFDEAMRLSQDLSAVGFGSITSAATMMGKALEDPILGLTAMRRVGVSFSEAQKQVIKSLIETGRAAEAQQIIMQGVKDQVGGAGASQANTLTGAYNQLGEAANNFWESVGGHIARGVQLRGLILNIADAIEVLNKRMENFNSPESNRKSLESALEHFTTGPGSKLTGRVYAPGIVPGVSTFENVEEVVKALRVELGFLSHEFDELAKVQDRLMASNAQFEASEQKKRDALSGGISKVEEEIRVLKLSEFEQLVDADVRKAVAAERANLNEKELKAIRDRIRAYITERETLSLLNESRKALTQARASTAGEIAGFGLGVGGKEAARVEADKLAEAQIRLGTVSDDLRQKIKQEAAEYGRLADQRARSGIREEIDFQQRLIGLTEEQIRLVEKLRDLYGNDVKKALESVEAAQLHQIESIKKGQEALTGLFTGISKEIREGKDIGKFLLDRALSLGDRIVDAQINAFIKTQSAEGGPLSGIAKLLGGALTPLGSSPANPMYVVPVGAGIIGSLGATPAGGGAFPSLQSIWDRIFGGGAASKPSVPGSSSFDELGFRSMFDPRVLSRAPGMTPTSSTFDEAGFAGGIATNIKGLTPQALQAAMSVSQQTGMPLSSALAFMKIESNFNPNIISSGGTGSYGGLFQVNRNQFPNWRDPMGNAAAAAQTIGQDSRYFQGQMGRAPTGAESYFMHMQGRAGAFSHWNNPGGRAWENFQSASGKSDWFSQKAISGNVGSGGDPNILSGQFWKNVETKFNSVEQSMSGVSTAASTAATNVTGMGSAANSATSGLQSFFQGLSAGGGGGFGGLGNLFSGAGLQHGFDFDRGGIVGMHGKSRYVHPAVFADAPRFERGGIADLAPDEVPIIAHRGEEIVREDNPRHRRNAGRMGSVYAPVTIIASDPEQFSKSRGQVSRSIAQAQRAAMRHN